MSSKIGQVLDLAATTFFNVLAVGVVLAFGFAGLT